MSIGGVWPDEIDPDQDPPPEHVELIRLALIVVLICVLLFMLPH